MTLKCLQNPHTFLVIREEKYMPHKQTKTSKAYYFRDADLNVSVCAAPITYLFNICMLKIGPKNNYRYAYFCGPFFMERFAQRDKIRL